MKILLNRSFYWALSITTTIITFTPENTYASFKSQIFSNIANDRWVIMCRILILLVAFGLFFLVGLMWRCFWPKRKIVGHNYSIIVEYGDIFKKKNLKKIIAFDECFTTELGEAPWQIKPTSVCGQYLTWISKNRKILNISELAKQNNVNPCAAKSAFDNKDCYEPGTLLPDNNGFLLMAFTKLSPDGLGVMDYSEYLACLNRLWEQIDLHYGSQDVCIPILGSGRTRFNGIKPTQQQLLDIMIDSYRLNQKKLTGKHNLHIICRKDESFSLNRIGCAM